METNIPINLQGFLNDNEKLNSFHFSLAYIPKDVLLNFATECVKTNYLYFNHLFKNCCNICDAEMTDEDRKLVSPQDFLIVCKKHRESAKAFQVDIERERLGFEKRVIV